MTRLLASTVVRSAPLTEGGRLVMLDLDARRVEKAAPIYPTQPDVIDPSSRGNARGGRGIAKIGPDRFVVADYHTLRIVSADLVEVDRVSTKHMVGLHELTYVNGRVLVAATTTDTLLEVDLEAGSEIAMHEPRTWPDLMAELGLATSPPADVDGDERIALIDYDLASDVDHLHLNAVTVRAGRTLCFLNRPGAVIDVESRTIVVRDPALRGGHNLVPHADDLLVNSSLAGELVRVSVEGGKRSMQIRRAPAVRGQALRQFARFNLQRQVGRLVPRLAPKSRPFFLRGLAVVGDRAYVGTSPAGIIQVDLASGAVASSWTFATNDRESVHGLCLVD